MTEHRRLPDFIAVGPQRTGTTWLHKVLAGHVGLPATKETDFFLKNFERGLDWYLAFFAACPSAVPMGEIDPNYFGAPIARERIAASIARCRIIVSLRDPTERAWSSYRTMRRDAWTRTGFEETVMRSEIIRESSRYAFHLSQWRRRFGADRVLVCLYDDLEADPQAYLDRICEFIGLPAVAARGITAATERVNTVTEAPRSRRIAQRARDARDWLAMRRWHRTERALEWLGLWRFAFEGGGKFGAMDPAAEARLREYFRPEVEALEAILGRDLDAWKRPHPRSEIPHDGFLSARGAKA
ncbi:MAG TPA: sulfotransferase [Candidatus Binataceae bacterium]|nr:sulfotransferase [Candidatus Binataceae bacterium]